MKQSPDGRFTATWLWGHADRGQLWRLPRPYSRPALSTTESDRLPQRTDYNRHAQFDPHGTSAILWSYRLAHWIQGTNENYNVRVVDITTGAVRGTCLRHSELVREAAFSPDGRYFATASFDGTARVWETATGRPAGPPLAHTNYVATVAFSPDGNTLATADEKGAIRFWNAATGKERPGSAKDWKVGTIGALAFSPDGFTCVAGGEGGRIVVWDLDACDVPGASQR